MTQISTVIWESISNSISEIFPISVLLSYHISNQCNLQSRNQVLHWATSQWWQATFTPKTKVEHSRSPGAPVFYFSLFLSLIIFLSSSLSDPLCFVCILCDFQTTSSLFFVFSGMPICLSIVASFSALLFISSSSCNSSLNAFYYPPLLGRNSDNHP